MGLCASRRGTLTCPPRRFPAATSSAPYSLRLASNPFILILNGPTVGVDVGSKNELHEMIKRLAGEGMGLLVISDDIPELLQTCNRILLLRHGRIVEEIMPSQTDANELAAKLVEG